MEYQHSKHVRVICDLSIGDIVTTDIHYTIKGLGQTIKDIKRADNCTSGFLVRISGYSEYIDSDWVDKI